MAYVAQFPSSASYYDSTCASLASHTPSEYASILQGGAGCTISAEVNAAAQASDCSSLYSAQQTLCAALDLADVADDPQFATNEDRHRNREALWPILERAFEKRPATEWVAALMEVGIPVAEVNGLDVALNDPQVRHRGMVLDLEDGAGSHAGVVGNPVKLSRSVSRPPAYPPALGGQTRAVLANILGLPDSEIDALLGAGVVAEKKR